MEQNLYVKNADGMIVEATVEQIVKVARSAMSRRLRRGAALSSP